MRWPYPADGQEPWYESFAAMVAAFDASGFASREDRHLIVGGGGSIDWTIPTLSWGSTIQIVAALTGFRWQIAAGSTVIEDGQVLYVVLTRGPTRNITLVPIVSNQVPSTDDALVLAVRMGTRVYLRSGVSILTGGSLPEFSPTPGGGTVLAVEDTGVPVDPAVTLMDFAGAGVTATQTAPGEVLITIPGGSTTDRYAPAIIVGNSANGDAAGQCHFLDTGNGAQLAAALAVADEGADIYIRPGTYDFTVAGGPAGAFAVPPRVKVRGAGRGHTIIRTRGQGDQGAFDVDEQSELEDLTIEVTLPTGAPSARYGIVELIGAHAEVRRVNVDFLGVWTSVEAANFEPVACFFVASGASDTRLIDCGAGLLGEGEMPSMWTLTSGAQALYGVLTEGSPSSVGCDIIRFKTVGGDGGVRAIKHVRVRDAEISNPLLVGVELLGFEADGSEVTGCLIEMFAAASGRYGIYLYTVEQCDVEGNRIVAWTGHSGSRGIMLVDADENIVAKNRLPDNWGAGIELDEDSDNNIVSLNNMPDCLLLDSGTGNEVAHNIHGEFLIDP